MDVQWVGGRLSESFSPSTTVGIRPVAGLSRPIYGQKGGNRCPNHSVEFLDELSPFARFGPNTGNSRSRPAGAHHGQCVLCCPRFGPYPPCVVAGSRRQRCEPYSPGDPGCRCFSRTNAQAGKLGRLRFCLAYGPCGSGYLGPPGPGFLFSVPGFRGERRGFFGRRLSRRSCNSPPLTLPNTAERVSAMKHTTHASPRALSRTSQPQVGSNAPHPIRFRSGTRCTLSSAYGRGPPGLLTRAPALRPPLTGKCFSQPQKLFPEMRVGDSVPPSCCRTYSPAFLPPSRRPKRNCPL